jgi:addiction module HigA family antidote
MSKSSTANKATKLTGIHPGKILLEELKDEGVGINPLAQVIRVPANRISLIVSEKRSIIADTAFRLAGFFGTVGEYWLNIREAIQREVFQRAVA